MENAENKPSTKRKIISFLVLFGFLVVLPFGSWFYLKKGADFRMEQLDKLKTKATFDFDKFEENYGELLPADSIKDKAILLGFDESIDINSLETQMDQLMEQYESSESINIALFVSKEESVEWGTNPGKYPGIYLIPGTMEPNTLFVPIEEPVPNDFTWALIDHKGAVRNFYTVEDFKSLIVHTAVILPTPKREKIELNRQ